MKQYIFTLLTLITLLPVLSAQSPLYIQFEPECVNQLEYQFTYTGQNLLMYSVAKADNELYFFVIGSKEPATTTNVPFGTVSCKSDDINATLIENINAGGRLAFIVFKVQNGFLSFPVETAGYIARSGTYFAFRTANYDFVMDTVSINYARNLSRPGVASPVYLTGKRSQECLQLYAFRLEPAQPELPRADVEIIPGIGVITNRTGHNGSEMEQNVYKLLKVNGISLDDYAYAVCHNPKDKENNPGTFITSLPPDANPNNAFKVENPFAEPDKEGYHTQPPNTDANVQLAKCPTPPGYGYHIVQPGDSIHSIARIYNVTEKSVMQWNNLQNPKQIKVCDKIWIIPQPAANTTVQAPAVGYHVVQKGETLFSIARKYNVTVANIREWNNMKSDDIQLGQRLVVTKSQAIAATSDKQQVTANTPAKAAQPALTATVPGNPLQGRLMHKTQSGETLNAIAWKYGYTTPYLRHINRNNINLPPGNDDKLPEGLFLTVSDGNGVREDLASFAPPVSDNRGNAAVIPGATSQINTATFEYIGEYIVQSDDTLASIAQRYSLTPEKLAAANNLKPGQEPAPRSILKIPK